jgi:hypothetical protein
MSVDLAVPLRTALIGNTGITSKLATYQSAPAVFTRRPVPAGVAYPVIVISPDVAPSDQDGINDFRPVIVRDIAIYGENDTAAKYRTVEELGYLVKALFHRNRRAITVTGYSVTDIIARGPMPAPVDDEARVGRVVELTIRLRKTA